MAKPKRPKSYEHGVEHDYVPETLNGHYFFGLTLDDEQKVFRDAIYDDNSIIISLTLFHVILVNNCGRLNFGFFGLLSF